MKPLSEVEYNPADPRNGVLRDLYSQIQMMRIHREVTNFLNILPEEYKDSELDLSLQETQIRLKRLLLPPFTNNPLLGYEPGTEEWDRQMASIHFVYMQL